MKKKVTIIIISVIIVAGVVAAAIFVQHKKAVAPSGNTTTQTTPDLIPANPNPDPANFTDAQIKEYNDDLVQALKYKSEGDQGQTESYYKAIEYYQKAEQVGQGRVWVPYLDLGNVYRLVKDFVKAEAAYNEGLKLVSEPIIYSAKIDLYKYDLKKSPEEVIALYQDALSKVVENVSLFASYGAYLEEQGHYKDALAVFEELSKRYPDNVSYKQEVESLKLKQ